MNAYNRPNRQRYSSNRYNSTKKSSQNHTTSYQKKYQEQYQDVSTASSVKEQENEYSQQLKGISIRVCGEEVLRDDNGSGINNKHNDDDNTQDNSTQNLNKNKPKQSWQECKNNTR